MQRIKLNESTAERRRIFFKVTTDGVAPFTTAGTGIKAKLSFGGAAEANSTNDITKVGSGVYYIELTQAEAATALGPMSASIVANTGLANAVSLAQIVGVDPYSGGAVTANNAVGQIAF